MYVTSVQDNLARSRTQEEKKAIATFFFRERVRGREVVKDFVIRHYRYSQTVVFGALPFYAQESSPRSSHPLMERPSGFSASKQCWLKNKPLALATVAWKGLEQERNGPKIPKTLLALLGD